jgi:hypothetical protein
MSFRRFLLLAVLVAIPAIAHAAVPLEAGLSFQPMTIPVGGTSVMSVEITNPNDVAAAGLAVSDTYPGGIFNASPASATTSCGGTVTAAPGASAFSFSGGSLAAHSTCVIAINVSGAQGLWVNALDPGSVTSTSAPSNAFFSTALLIVVDAGPPSPKPMSVALSFTPSSIHAGKTTTLSIALTNPNATPMNGIAFTTEYPQALINTPDGARSTCGGTATTKPGSRTLDFSGGSIPAKSTCRVDVVLRGSLPGTYTVSVAGKSASVTVSSK